VSRQAGTKEAALPDGRTAIRGNAEAPRQPRQVIMKRTLSSTLRCARSRLRMPAAGVSIALICTPLAHGSEAWTPSGAFVQVGVGDEAQMLVLGAVWDWRWQKPTVVGPVTGYWEVSFGRWSSQAEPKGHASAWITQLGVTPVLRWCPGLASEGWFVEAGIGANLLAPIYRSRNKRFSTAFNFGDHLGLGWRSAGPQQQEFVLRVQHFSNAGIKRPNPGENFIQLRYLVRF
jgi:lipid A 3-O-deacylase